MGTSLTGLTPATTYDALIKVGDNGPLSATAKVLSDGLGNDSILALSTTAVGIGTTTPLQLLHVSGGSARIQRNVSGATSFSDEQVTIYNLQAANVGNQATIGFHLNSTSWGSDFTAARISAVTTNAANGTTDLAFGVSVDGSIAVAPERFRITPNGVTFNGDTAAANALDDYEEGTFTPTIEGSTTAGTATYVVQSGRYTKIGNQVNVQIDLSWNSGTGTGDLRIVGLPFTNVSNNMAGTIGFIENITLIALNYATTYVAPSSTRFDFVQSPVGGGAVSSVTYDAAGRLIISATYFTS